MISVLVLTKNEEGNIADCLRSLSWSDDIVVLDSYSEDKTVEIARSLGARVVQRRFDDWSSHQNYAVSEIKFAHPWVYYSDADERVPQDLRDEIINTVKAEMLSPKNSAYRLRYRNYFFGRWIRHCSAYPVWVTRLFIPSKISWRRLVNPVPIVMGNTGVLRAHFDHFSFNNGLAAWFDKHNRYSTQEATEGELLRPCTLGEWKGLFHGAVTRRQTLKRIAFGLPFRPELHFLYRYIVRMGFLDGYPGFLFCRMMASYETMIVAKQYEMRHGSRQSTG